MLLAQIGKRLSIPAVNSSVSAGCWIENLLQMALRSRFAIPCRIFSNAGSLRGRAVTGGYVASYRNQRCGLATAVPPVTQDATSSKGPTAMVFLNMGGPSTTSEVEDFLSRLFVGLGGFYRRLNRWLTISSLIA